MSDILDFTNMEIEQAALGIMITQNAAVMDSGIEIRDFCFPLHQEIFQCMQSFFNETQSFGVESFVHFQHKDLPKEQKAFEYIQSCAWSVSTPTLDQAKYYSTTLKDYRHKRELLIMLNNAQRDLLRKPTNDILHQIMSFSTNTIDTQSIKSGEAVYEEILNSLEKPKELWSTGLNPIDKAMSGGLYQGYTYGFAGQEKAGKTTLAHTISYNLGVGGCRHLYIAMEMGSEQIEQRNLARQMEINSMEFLKPTQSLKEKMSRVQSSENIYYLDSPGFCLEDILREITVAKIKHGIRGFIVDYWQLVGGKHRGETEEAHLRNVAQRLADYARQHDLWCILLAQLNKEGQLFGGNGLRKACDQLYFIHQPEKHPNHRWLEMDATRYTLKVPVGDEDCPSLLLNKYQGPYFTEA